MSGNITTWMVSVPHSSGVEINAYLNVDGKPIRQQQKLKTLKEYVRKHPKGWKKRLELAQILCLQGLWEEAIAQYYLVIKQQPQLINIQLKLAKILHILGRESEAVRLYKKSLITSNNLASRKHFQGLIESSSHNYHQAIIEFESAISLEPSNRAHWYALAKTQMTLEAPHKALKVLRALNIQCLQEKSEGCPDKDSQEQDSQENNPNIPQTIIQLIYTYDALLELGNLKVAEEYIQKAFKLAPHDTQVFKRMIDWRCRMKLVNGKAGKYTKQLIKDGLKTAPTAEIYNSLSCYYILRGDWEEGISILKNFVMEHPQNPLGWYYYAICLFQLGKNQLATAAILQAYKLYPQECEIYRALCYILPGSNHTNLLPEIIPQMLDLFSHRPSIWISAAKVYAETFQRFQEACNLSSKAIALQPDSANIWFYSGEILASCGEYYSAIDMIEQGWNICFENNDFYQSVDISRLIAALRLAEIYQYLDNDKNSNYWFEIALKYTREISKFDQTNAYYWEGRIFAALGNLEKSAMAHRYPP